MEYVHGGDIYTHKGMTDFSVNLNPFGPGRAVVEAARKSMDQIGNYPDASCRKLKSALAKRLEVPAEHIICGNGAADLIFGLVYALKPGRALVTAPSFTEYEQALRAWGCCPDYLFLEEKEGFSLNVEALLQRIIGAAGEGRPYDMVFLCNPNNPTGIPVPTGEIRRVAEVCLQSGTRLIMDECFCDFLDEPEACSAIPFLGEYPNLFVLKAFTKLYSKDSVEESFAQGKLVFFAGGTGHPYFSTDTATVLRAVEIEADAILLAKAVDGIYDSDPKVNPDAVKYDEISIQEVVDKKLAAMDLTASIMCLEQKMPMLVFALDEENSIINTVHGKFSGTKVTV